jgi:hypothetical protein
MDRLLIDVEEANVINILDDIKIIEERFNEEYEIRFNNEELVIEIANLLLDAEKEQSNANIIEKKTQIFQNLIAGATSFDGDRKLTQFKILAPIINVVTELVLLPDEEKDDDFEQDNMVVMKTLHSILSKYSELSTNRFLTYPEVVPRLYSHMRPWLRTRNSTNVFRFKSPCDAIIAKNKRTTRMLGPDTHFDGDETEIVGVFKAPLPRHKTPTRTISISHYFEGLKRLSKGDQVKVCFNDFFDEIYDDKCVFKAIITDTTSTGLHVQLESYKINGIFVPYQLYCPVLVFKDVVPDHFTKRDNDNYNIEYLFDPSIALDENLAFIIPISASEVIHLKYNKVKTLENLFQVNDQVLKPYGYDMRDIDWLTFYKIKRVLNTRQPNPIRDDARRNSKTPWCKKSFELILDVLSRWDEHAQQRTSSIKQRYASRIDTIESGIAQNIRQEQSRCVRPRDGHIAKHVTSYGELEQVHPGNMFFQPELDPNFGLKETMLRDKPAISDDEMKRVLREKFTSMKKKDVEYEIESVLADKRKIRPGDFAVLTLPDCDTRVMYILAHQDGKLIWQKTNQTPRTDASCVKLNELDLLMDAIRAIKDVCQINNASTGVVESIARSIKARETPVARAEALVSSLEITDDVTKYFGDTEYVDLEGLLSNKEAFNEHAILANDDLDVEDPSGKHALETEILQFLIDYLNIGSLSSKDVQRIARVVHETCKGYKKEDNLQRFEEFKKEKWKDVNNKLYTTNPKYQAKVDKLLAAKYKEQIVSINGEFYSKLYVSMLACLSVTVMAKYPSVTMLNVIPSCASSLSYAGYPLKDKMSIDPSIHQYMACALKSLSTPSDERLKRFFDMPVNQVREAIENAVDIIIKHEPQLAIDVQLNKNNVLSTPKAKPGITITTSFHGFKPDIQKSLNDVPKSKLTDALADLSDKFVGNPLHVHHRSLVRSFVAPKKPSTLPRLFAWKSMIKQADAKVMKAPLQKVDAVATQYLVLTDGEWDDLVNTKLVQMSESITRHISSSVSKEDWPLFEAFRLLGTQQLHLIETQNRLHAFIKYRLLCHLHNSVKPFLGSGSIIETRVSFVIQRLSTNHKLPYMDVHDESHIIKNNIVLLRTFLQAMMDILGEDDFDSQLVKENTGIIVATVIRYLMMYLKNNIIDANSVKEKMDELRERRKEDLMNKYKADDDERKLQMTLRTIGLVDWDDTGIREEQQQPIDTAADAQVIDNADNEFDSYKGENADDDEDADA